MYLASVRNDVCRSTADLKLFWFKTESKAAELRLRRKRKMKKSYEIDMCNGPLWGKLLLFSVPLIYPVFCSFCLMRQILWLWEGFLEIMLWQPWGLPVL